MNVFFVGKKKKESIQDFCPLFNGIVQFFDVELCKWSKWSHSVITDSLRPHGPIRLLHPWNFPGKSTGVGCHLSCAKSLYILGMNFLSNISFANIFSHSVDCHFYLLKNSFTIQKNFSLMQLHLFIFVFSFPCLRRLKFKITAESNQDGGGILSLPLLTSTPKSQLSAK